MSFVFTLNECSTFVNEAWHKFSTTISGFCTYDTLLFFKEHPPISTLLSLMDKVANFVTNHSFYQQTNETEEKNPFYQTHQTDKKHPLTKMRKNTKKAYESHHKKNDEAYITRKELNTFFPLNLDQVNLTLSEGCFALQGIRESMEDAHFYEEIEEGVITGVLDGHGGIEVANYVKDHFAVCFSQCMKDTQGDVRASFNQACATLQQQLKKSSINVKKIGSTAVVCFIEPKTKQIYTATLGDSEANIYRKINGNWKSIPISDTQDWSKPKEAARAARILNDPFIERGWPQTSDPKDLRFPSPSGYSVNVSRSFGDTGYTGYNEGTQESAVIQKPKVTVETLLPGDILILACDGLKDFVSETQIVKELNQTCTQSAQEIAEHLTSFAIKNCRSKDNVTVLAIKVSNRHALK